MKSAGQCSESAKWRLVKIISTAHWDFRRSAVERAHWQNEVTSEGKRKFMGLCLLGC